MTEETLGLEVSRQGDRAVLRASGELDLGSVDDFRSAVRECIEEADVICVDLCELTFIDSTGLSTLLDLRHSAASKGVEFGVRIDEGPVRDAVENTGLAHLLNA